MPMLLYLYLLYLDATIPPCCSGSQYYPVLHAIASDPSVPHCRLAGHR